MMTPAVVVDILDFLKVKVKFGSGRVKTVKYETLQAVREDAGEDGIEMAKATVSELSSKLSSFRDSMSKILTSASAVEPSPIAVATPGTVNPSPIAVKHSPVTVAPSPIAVAPSPIAVAACTQLPSSPALPASPSTPASPPNALVVVGERCDDERYGTRYYAKVLEVYDNDQVKVEFATIVTSDTVDLDKSVDDPLYKALRQFIEAKPSASTQPTTTPKKNPDALDLRELNPDQVVALLKQWRLFKFFGNRFVFV